MAKNCGAWASLSKSLTASTLSFIPTRNPQTHSALDPYFYPCTCSPNGMCEAPRKSEGRSEHPERPFSSPASSTSNNLNHSSSTRRNDDYNMGTLRSSYHSELYGAAPPPSGDSNLYSRGPSITPPTPNLTHTPPPFSLSRLGKLDGALRTPSPTSFDYQYNYNSPRTAALNYSYDEPPHESSLYRDRMLTRRPSYDGGGGNDGTVGDTGWSSPRGGNRRLQ